MLDRMHERHHRLLIDEWLGAVALSTVDERVFAALVVVLHHLEEPGAPATHLRVDLRRRQPLTRKKNRADATPLRHVLYLLLASLELFVRVVLFDMNRACHGTPRRWIPGACYNASNENRGIWALYRHSVIRQAP